MGFFGSIIFVVLMGNVIMLNMFSVINCWNNVYNLYLYIICIYIFLLIGYYFFDVKIYSFVLYKQYIQF